MGRSGSLSWGKEGGWRRKGRRYLGSSVEVKGQGEKKAYGPIPQTYTKTQPEANGKKHLCLIRDRDPFRRIANSSPPLTSLLPLSLPFSPVRISYSPSPSLSRPISLQGHLLQGIARCNRPRVTSDATRTPLRREKCTYPGSSTCVPGGRWRVRDETLEGLAIAGGCGLGRR